MQRLFEKEKKKKGRKKEKIGNTKLHQVEITLYTTIGGITNIGILIRSC